MIKILDGNLNRLGVIKNVITSKRLEEINGENILDFEAVLDAKLNALIDENSIFELDNEYFDTAFLKKESNEDGALLVEVEAEHVSYRLNNPLYNLEFFTKTGDPAYILGEILEDTEFSVGSVEYTDPVTYSAQEAKSRRQILMEFVALLGGELEFDGMTISIVQHRGSINSKPIIKDRHMKVVSKTVNKREKDIYGNPVVSYTCEPIYLPGDSYSLGDNVILIQKDLGVHEELRVVRLTRNPYEPMDITFEFSNYVDGLASSLYHIETYAVVKDKLYNGTRIGPEYGFENIRSDKRARSYFRSDEMKFQSGDGTGENWEDRLYFVYDSVLDETRLVFEGNVKSRSLEVSDFIRILGKNSQITIDEWGINPDFMKRFPNKIFNSGFEQYDKKTMAPLYWAGTGVVSPLSNWDGTVSLKLEPGQYIEQGMFNQDTHAGANPEWWGNLQTRVTFRHKGGGVRVSVLKVSDDSPYTIVDNFYPDNPVSGAYLDYLGAASWEEGVRTFYFQPDEGAGKVKVRFENVGAEDVYLDAVQIEPDFTGKWGSFYTAGPYSIAGSTINVPEINIDEFMEYDLIAWDASGVIFEFAQAYSLKPITSVQLQGPGVETITTPFMIVCKPIQDEDDNYIGVEILFIGPDVPVSLDAEISITCICREVVEEV